MQTTILSVAKQACEISNLSR